MNNDLLIKSGDNIFFRITSILGAIDEDKIIPSVWVAQNTEIQRILKKELYDKIINDFKNDTLLGDYLEIYDNHISPILVFLSVGDFILKNSIMVGNGGNFKHQSSNSVVADSKETERLSKYYKDMAAHFERQFYIFMQDVNIPEWQTPPSNNSFNFGWVF
ncbi:MAG: hypothetical protein V4572_12105 [Bacteroidota bacterium]